jgi:hypothetical protein
MNLNVTYYDMTHVLCWQYASEAESDFVVCYLEDGQELEGESE